MGDPILIMLIGMVIVVGGIIGLKLHPVLSLLLAAVAVAVLTPSVLVEQYFISKGTVAAEAAKLAHKSIGERIATLRHTELDLSVPVAFMSPEPARGSATAS